MNPDNQQQKTYLDLFDEKYDELISFCNTFDILKYEKMSALSLEPFEAQKLLIQVAKKIMKSRQSKNLANSKLDPKMTEPTGNNKNLTKGLQGLRSRLSSFFHINDENLAQLLEKEDKSKSLREVSHSTPANRQPVKRSSSNQVTMRPSNPTVRKKSSMKTITEDPIPKVMTASYPVQSSPGNALVKTRKQFSGGQAMPDSPKIIIDRPKSQIMEDRRYLKKLKKNDSFSDSNSYIEALSYSNQHVGHLVGKIR